MDVRPNEPDPTPAPLEPGRELEIPDDPGELDDPELPPAPVEPSPLVEPEGEPEPV